MIIALVCFLIVQFAIIWLLFPQKMVRFFVKSPSKTSCVTHHGFAQTQIEERNDLTLSQTEPLLATVFMVVSEESKKALEDEDEENTCLISEDYLPETSELKTIKKPKRRRKNLSLVKTTPKGFNENSSD